jgi:hypothetical protein
MDDEPRETIVIHLLKLVISNNQSTHEQNMEILDDVVLLHMSKGFNTWSIPTNSMNPHQDLNMYLL